MDKSNVLAALIGIALIALIFGIWFIIEAIGLYLLCWGLKAIGITSIGGWTITFSWPLVIIFMVITSILSGIFSHKGE